MHVEQFLIKTDRGETEKEKMEMYRTSPNTLILLALLLQFLLSATIQSSPASDCVTGDTSRSRRNSPIRPTHSTDPLECPSYLPHNTTEAKLRRAQKCVTLLDSPDQRIQASMIKSICGTIRKNPDWIPFLIHSEATRKLRRIVQDNIITSLSVTFQRPRLCLMGLSVFSRLFMDIRPSKGDHYELFLKDAKSCMNMVETVLLFSACQYELDAAISLLTIIIHKFPQLSVSLLCREHLIEKLFDRHVLIMLMSAQQSLLETAISNLSCLERSKEAALDCLREIHDLEASYESLPNGLLERFMGKIHACLVTTAFAT